MHPSKPTYFALIGVLAALGITSCGGEAEWPPEVLGHGQGTAQNVILEKGRDSYGVYCIGCHGEAGDGKGPAARFLEPKPRDFKTCRLKFGGVPAGEAPSDADYIHTITHGLKGTSMPSFRFVAADERQAIVAYLRKFCPKKETPGTSIQIDADPWARSPEAGIAEGAKVYYGYARCWSCHPAYVTKPEIATHLASFSMPATGLRTNIYESETKDSDWGSPIRAPDFLVDRIKTGTDLDVLVKIIGSGIGGTAMPTWAGGLKPRQLWGLAYYVSSVAQLRGTPEARALMEKMATQPAFDPTPPVPEQQPEDAEAGAPDDGAEKGATP
ncbi:MAG: cytochrome c [Myxococcota bacterium]